MKIREVNCKRWFLPKKFVAVVLYPFIFYKGYPDYRIIVHEHKHIEQIKHHGVIRFYLLYLYYTIKFGYWLNPFEIEARSAENKTVQ